MSQFQSNDFLSAAQVRARYGNVSHMWIERKLASEGFPAPVRFGGRLRFWRVSDLLAWERQKIGGETPAMSKIKSEHAA